MARMIPPAVLQPVTISKFLGLNLDVNGDTQLQLGESGNMTNFYITKDFNLKKMEGYTNMLPTTTTDPIRGLWYGKLNGSFHYLFVKGGKIYKFNDGYWQDYTQWDDGTWLDHVTEVGTITDAVTRFFEFDDNVYVINGNDYKKWDGTGTFVDVTGYIPKIAINVPPAGGGDSFEQLNLLTGSKRMTFNGDGTAGVYQLTETNIDSVDEVTIGGVVTSSYTVNLALGQVIPSNPADFVSGQDNIQVTWTKGTGSRDSVLNNRASELFGPVNNTRVFLYGNQDAQNRIIYSGLAEIGTSQVFEPSVEYFPSNNFLNVGSINSAVTDIQRQYSKMVVTKDSYDGYALQYTTTVVEGETLIVFEVSPLNNARGNVAFAQGQIINNNPLTIDSAMVLWLGTNVLDEKNVFEFSEKINPDLTKFDLSTAITVDWQERWEHWTALNDSVYIYNYYLSTANFPIFSRLKLADVPSCFIVINGDLYFGTDDGKIMKFDKLFRNFNGTAINPYWEMNFFDFGASNLRKTMNRVWASLLPEPKASAIINYITDIKGGTNPKTIKYTLFSYENIDYADWSYQINYNPQPFRLKMKAKKWTFLKLTIKNENDDNCTILNFDIKYEYGGESK